MDIDGNYISKHWFTKIETKGDELLFTVRVNNIYGKQRNYQPRDFDYYISVPKKSTFIEIQNIMTKISESFYTGDLIHFPISLKIINMIFSEPFEMNVNNKGKTQTVTIIGEFYFKHQYLLVTNTFDMYDQDGNHYSLNNDMIDSKDKMILYIKNHGDFPDEKSLNANKDFIAAYRMFPSKSGNFINVLYKELFSFDVLCQYVYLKCSEVFKDVYRDDNG